MLEVSVAGHSCRLMLGVIAYQFPKEQSGPDANWLEGEAKLDAGTTGRFHANHRVWLRTDDLEQFRNELREVVSSLNGTATMRHFEEQVGCTVDLKNGRGSLTAFINEHIGCELRVRDYQTDQSYLQETLRELDAVVKAFPVRGTPA